MKHWLTPTFLLTVGALAVGIGFCSVRSTQTSKTNAQGANLTSPWAWTTEEWKGDDRPYARIRTDVDNTVAQGQLTEAVIERYWTEREKNRQDPERLFRWVYAVYKAEQTHPPIHFKQFPGPGAFMYDFSSPPSYEFTRIRFLIDAQYGGEPELVAVGKRLLRRNPKDYDVQYYLVEAFKPWKSEAEKQEALSYAQDLIRKNPNKPSAYGALGDVYHACWVVKRQPTDAEKAITAYEQYLRLAPLNYESRPATEKIIQRMRSYMVGERP